MSSYSHSPCRFIQWANNLKNNNITSATMSARTFFFSWGDFSSVATVQHFQDIRDARDFLDVTLVCEDGTRFQAHRVVLSLSSPVLR